MSKKDKFGSLLNKKESSVPKEAHNEILNNLTSVSASENTSINKNDEGEIDNIAQKIANANKKREKLKFEDTHSKQTYWIRNDVLKGLNKIAGNERGAKTKIINQALINYFKKLERELTN